MGCWGITLFKTWPELCSCSVNWMMLPFLAYGCNSCNFGKIMFCSLIFQGHGFSCVGNISKWNSSISVNSYLIWPHSLDPEIFQCMFWVFDYKWNSVQEPKIFVCTLEEDFWLMALMVFVLVTRPGEGGWGDLSWPQGLDRKISG